MDNFVLFYQFTKHFCTMANPLKTIVFVGVNLGCFVVKRMRFHVIPFFVVQIAHRNQRNALFNAVSGAFFNGNIVIINGLGAVFFIEKNITQRRINLV